MATPTWNVPVHRPLTLLADGLWQVDAEMPGPPFQRRMTLIRLASGELVVHSAVACDEATMAQIDGIGRIAFIVVPSRYHRMDAPAYAARYPSAKVITPAGSAEAVRRVVRVDGGLEVLPPDPSLRWEAAAGSAFEAVLIHTDSRGGVTLIFNDAFMNIPKRSGWKGLLLGAIGSSGGPKVTKVAQWFIIKDHRAFAGQLQRLAALPGLARIVPGHGDLIDRDPSAALGRAAAALAA
jgi:hypothetical protein